jgi:hypothetical protein
MTFQWSFGSILISVIVLMVTLFCCALSWRRSGCTRAVGLLETLRLFLVILVLVTLNQPEYHQQFTPTTKPVLVVLHDVSDSMNTQDVADPARPAVQPDTRRQTTAEVVVEDKWARLNERMDVVMEPFSSTLANAGKGTDIAVALSNAADRFPSLRGVVLLSDGDWNTGESPHLAATMLRMKQIPVFAACIGSEDRLPDMALTSVDAPTFGVVGQTLRIPFRIVSWLPNDRDVAVTMSGTAGDEVTAMVRVNGMGQVSDTLEWKPGETGNYSLTVSIPVDAAESINSNNSLTFPIAIRNEALQVLIVDTFPRWEYRYLRNALERDPGVVVHCLLFHPDLESVGGGRGYLEQFPSDKTLYDYDVVFLGDVGLGGEQLSLDNLKQLRQLVRSHAGGLVLLPGFRGFQQTLAGSELEDLNPVIGDPAQPKGIGSARPARFELTETGRRSLLTRLESDDEDNERTWSTLPGFHWYAATLRAKVGSQVLATHDTASTRFGRVPLIATRSAGTGKVLFMGTDGAWRWRKGMEDRYHYRFWSQVVRWMAYQRNMSQGESMRVFYSPDRPEAGRLLTLHANVMTRSGEPLASGTVIVQATSQSGQMTSIQLTPSQDDDWGLYSGTFTPLEGGVYRTMTICRETGASLATNISVQGRELEQIGEPARPDVLQEITDITQGQLVPIEDIDKLVDRLAKLPEPKPVVRNLRIWSHPLWGAVLLLLLGVFWSARKAAGLV